MYRATTPPHTFTLPIETNTCDKIQVTYKQGDFKIVKTYENGTLPSGMSLNGKVVSIKLTQEETKQFKADAEVKAQVRAKTIGGDVFASQKFNVSVADVLSDEVL